MPAMKKPINLRSLDNDARHGELPKQPTTQSFAAAALARPSAWLDPEAKKFWKKVVPQLNALSVLHTCDRWALETLCSNYSQWVNARKAAGVEFSVTSAAGTLKKNPAQAAAANAQAQFTKSLEMFGLSPTSRVKLGLTGREDNEDAEFEALLR